MMGVRLSCVALGLMMAGCDSGPQAAETASLKAGVVAKVGGQSIDSAFLAQVTQASGRDPAEALRGLVADALFAQEAEQHFSATALTGVVERGALARELLEGELQRAKRAGPPTSQELAELRRERWMDVDRPGASLTAHAVALVENPEMAEKAREFAELIKADVDGVDTVKEFIKRAQRVRRAGLEKRVETLPFMTRDGRAVYPNPEDARRLEPPPAFDLAYAEAANALKGPGTVSEVIKSSAGYHVIFLADRVGERRLTDAQLAQEYSDDVYTARAKRVVDALLEKLHAEVPVERSRSAEQLTALATETP